MQNNSGKCQCILQSQEINYLFINVLATGKSLSEALLFAKHRENMWCTKIVLNVRNNFCTEHVLPKFELWIFMYWNCNSMNNLLSYLVSWCKIKSFWQRFTCNPFTSNQMHLAINYRNWFLALNLLILVVIKALKKFVSCKLSDSKRSGRCGRPKSLNINWERIKNGRK